MIKLMVAVHNAESCWVIIVQRVTIMNHMLTVSYKSRYIIIVSSLTVVIPDRFVLHS